MDIFEELERMANNAVSENEIDDAPSEPEISRWQTLFGYTYTEAIEQIQMQKSDLTRSRVSDDHWELVGLEKEAQGYSRIAYDHWIATGNRSIISSPTKSRSSDILSCQGEASYLVLLGNVLSTPRSIQEVADLAEPPKTIKAASETSDGIWCAIDGRAKQAIKDRLSQQRSSFSPVFTRLSKANKDLAYNSIHPTLGVESTLPQHRLNTNISLDPNLPQSRGIQYPTLSPIHQDKYPVWYFFYGTLAEPEILGRTLSLPQDEPPLLVPANTSGGRIRTWASKYNALIDGESTDQVFGFAYQVACKEHEDSLLLYETENYEVVRCQINMEMQDVQGLTFRFVGTL